MKTYRESGKKSSENIMDISVTPDSDVSFDFCISERWLSGIPYEVAFWRSYYRNKRSRKELLGWSQYQKECKLDNFDVGTYISGLEKENPVIVDVGCALSYMFSNIFCGKEYDVVYLDPLAPFYNKILDDYSLDFPRITFGMGEILSQIFPTDSVSFFHIRNALDHSVRPMMVIWQALMCLHVDGVLYLNHKPNEAEHEAYVGFHQYNLDCQDGSLVIWNKSERIDVGKVLGEYAEVAASVTEEGRIVGIIKKVKEIPSDHQVVRESASYASGMLQSMMTYFHKFPNAATYQVKRGSLSVFHGFIRLIPGGVLRKLKEIISGKKVKV